MSTNDVLGADPEDLHQLAAAIRAAGGTLDGVDARLWHRLNAVAWMGNDAIEIRRSFEVEVRNGSRLAAIELRATADRLEAQASEQRRASGDVSAGPGERGGEVRSVRGGDAGSATSDADAVAAPVTVVTETRTVGVEAGASPAGAKVTATLMLTVHDDGAARVVVSADQRIGALAGEASAGVGAGLTGSRGLSFSFADEATARRFIERMTEALTPDLAALGDVGAPHPLSLGLGLGAPALVIGGGKAILDDISRDAAGVLVANTPAEIDGSVGGSADVWGTAAFDRLKVDADLARGATYHPIDGTWTTNTALGAGTTVPIFGGIKADLDLAASVSTTIGPDGVTDGTWTVEATGGGGAAVLGALGLGAGGPALDPAGSSRVRFEARLAATDTSTSDALNEFNQGVVAPHRAASTLDRMVREGELSITVEHHNGSNDGRSYGPVRVISEHEVTRSDSVYRRSPGGEWTEVVLQE